MIVALRDHALQLAEHASSIVPQALLRGALVLVAPVLLIGSVSPASAQVPDTSWNTPRVLDLVDQARRVRQSATVDSTLTSYQADARGFVYFFVDRVDSPERSLVKADQVALDVFWRAPGETRQRIVGLRDEKVLPTNIRYHLDHLTVVQDEFGDLIRVGDGDEVASVLHPAAPGAETTYDYRLTDSLTLSFAGATQPTRVYEIDVRPRDLNRPGFVGTLSVARESGAIVRMNFGFTPASYVDPYLDYIRIALENALWLGSHWLPYRQEVELRREMPIIDFLGGTVIRGRFEIGNYRFNERLPDLLFISRSVLSVPPAQREAFAFEEPLFSDLDEAGLATSDEIARVRRQIDRLVAREVLSGLTPARLHWRSFSQGVRYNRAEGAYLGLGSSLRLGPELRSRLHAGWSFGRRRPSASLELAADEPSPATRLEADWWSLEDIGPITSASGVINTLASLGQRDYLDPYFRSGLALRHRFGSPETTNIDVSLAWRQHHSASLVADDPDNTAFRPVRAIEAGNTTSLQGRLVFPSRASGWHSEIHSELAHLNQRIWGRIEALARWSRAEAWSDLNVEVSAHAGTTLGADPPPQALFLLGGRNTLPGHQHREMVGRRYWLTSGRIGHALAQPLASLHLGAAIGGTSGLQTLPVAWDGQTDARLRGSVWVGLDALWDVVSLDVAHGVGPRGDWAFILSISPRFHPWL